MIVARSVIYVNWHFCSYLTVDQIVSIYWTNFHVSIRITAWINLISPDVKMKQPKTNFWCLQTSVCVKFLLYLFWIWFLWIFVPVACSTWLPLPTALLCLCVCVRLLNKCIITHIKVYINVAGILAITQLLHWYKFFYLCSNYLSAITSIEMCACCVLFVTRFIWRFQEIEREYKVPMKCVYNSRVNVSLKNFFR